MLDGRAPDILAAMDGAGGLESLARYLDEQDSRPFADIEAASRDTLQRLSFAGQEAAENLLAKARRALDAGDAARASEFAERAARLPFDEHEETMPAAFAVHMDLFCVVTDALEESEQGDTRWLDAALDVLASAEERAACDLRDVLVDIDHDYRLSQAEHRRIRVAIASVPSRPELTDLTLTTSELRDHIMVILAARRDYERTVAALAQRAGG